MREFTPEFFDQILSTMPVGRKRTEHKRYCLACATTRPRHAFTLKPNGRYEEICTPCTSGLKAKREAARKSMARQKLKHPAAFRCYSFAKFQAGEAQGRRKIRTPKKPAPDTQQTS